jgi:hypothetical protein
MTSFTTRVTLHKVKEDSEVYTELHDYMEQEGFKRTIKSGDDITYHLPHAEYNFVGNVSRDDVLERAKKAAKKTNKNHSVLVTESAGRTWSGLDKVE